MRVSTEPSLGIYLMKGNMIMVRAGEVQIRALLDTGSVASFVSEPVLHQININRVKIGLETNFRIYQGANQEPLQLKPYTATFDIDIEDVSTSVTCFIAPKLSAPLVLGWKWMEENHVIIRPDAATMSIWHKMFCL